MAEEHIQEDQDIQEAPDSAVPSDAQDSLALTRTKNAYQPDGKKFTESVKEKRSPQRVITANLNQVDPFTEDDIDDETLIAPGKATIGKSYQESGKLKSQKSYRPVAESVGGDDTLSLQSADKRSAQTISFKVKGIQWRSGYANTLDNTPLGHAIHPLSLPAFDEEIPEGIKKQGIVIRPVNPRLRVVLNQLLPPQFRKEVTRYRKKCERMKLLAIFYLPGTPSSFVGFIHEFVSKKGGKTFYLYIQTSVGKAPVAILDEVLKTLEAGLPDGETADDLEEYEAMAEEDDLPELDYDFKSEVEKAMKSAGDTLNDSIPAYAMRQTGRIFRDWSLDFIRIVDKQLARFIQMLAAVLRMMANSPFVQAIAATIQATSKVFVKAIYFMNKFLLAIARSPVTKAIFENIGRIFKIFGRLFLVFGMGIKNSFKFIGSSFGFLGDFVKNPGESMSAISVEFPSIKKDIFGTGGGKDKDKAKLEKSSKINARKNKKRPMVTPKAKARGRALPPPKPLKKGTKPLPPAKMGAKGPGLGGPGGIGGKGGAGGGKTKAERDRELGYFEDQAF